MFLSCVVSSQESKTVVLEYSLEKGQSACPGENIIFTCIVRESEILKWSSDEYIGINGAELDFNTNDTEGREKHVNNSDTYAILISVVKVGKVSLESTLHIRSNQSSRVSCIAGSGESEQSIDFTVLGDGNYTLAD